MRKAIGGTPARSSTTSSLFRALSAGSWLVWNSTNEYCGNEAAIASTQGRPVPSVSVATSKSFQGVLLCNTSVSHNQVMVFDVLSQGDSVGAQRVPNARSDCADPTRRRQR